MTFKLIEQTTDLGIFTLNILILLKYNSTLYKIITKGKCIKNFNFK